MEKPPTLQPRSLNPPGPDTPGFRARTVLFIAQGFGAGRIPYAPGTAGAAIGLGWFASLLWTRNPVLFCAAIAASIALSISICGKAEKILKRKDAPSIVLDEIIAIPVCFLFWLGVTCWRSGRWPPPGFFFQGKTWFLTLGIFALFRLFDVMKPWPIGRSQELRGGLGVVMDDVLAAVYVNAATGVIWVAKTAINP